MVVQSLFRYGIAFLLISDVFCCCFSEEAEGLTKATWEGYVAYFPVPRQRVAEKLSQLQDENGCDNAVELNLPRDPVLPNLIGPDQHVVAVGIGHLKAASVDEDLPQELKERYATEADTVQFYIPFLTGKDPHAEPVYKLAIGSFVSTDKPFIQPNVAVPTINVDLVSITTSGIRVQDGGEIFSMNFPDDRVCITADHIIEEEFEDYNRELTTSFLTETNPSICNENVAAGLDICSVKIPTCPTQFWRRITLSQCDIKPITLGEISAKFQEFSLLAADEEPAVLSFANSGNCEVGLETPSI